MSGQLAAIVYRSDEDCDALLCAFADALQERGVRVNGLVQVNIDNADCLQKDMGLRDIGTGATIDICQDLGSGSVGACRVDPNAMAEAAGVLRQAMARPTDLLIINKFGKLESEGTGLLAEIGQACADGHTIVIGVPKRFVAAWDAFACGTDLRLPCTREALEQWFKTLSTGELHETP